jgi:hypothetical protein
MKTERWGQTDGDRGMETERGRVTKTLRQTMGPEVGVEQARGGREERAREKRAREERARAKKKERWAERESEHPLIT